MKAASLLRRSWPARVTLIYLLSRLLSWGIMLWFAWVQGKSAYSGPHPDYVTFANFWDARWYNYIAAAGYPSALPIDASGHVLQNAWAFLPVYPFLVGGLAVMTHLLWSTVAIAVSLLAGWGFVMVLYRLMQPRLTAAQSTWAVIFACVAPVAPIFGVAYAEALFLFLLALSLLLLIERHYLLLALVLPILSFTRPGAIAFALTIGGHWLIRWRDRVADPFPLRQRVGIALLAVWSALLGVAWTVIAALVTGQLDAYMATELAWRAAYIGYVELIPGTAWFQSANWRYGQPWTWILPITAVIGFTALLFTPAAKRLGGEQRWWLGSYGLYLFAVFFPQSSSARILAPMFSVSGILAQIRASWIKVLIALLMVAGQFWWIAHTWMVSGLDWTPP